VDSRYWRAEDARAVLAALEASGLGVGAFCRRYGVGRQRVRYWRRQLAGGQPAAGRPVFLPVRVLETTAGAAAEPIEVVVRGERTVRVRPGFDRELLRRVLEVLEC
jgi:transposase-like protein